MDTKIDLVIKAASQKIDDFKIECDLNWTVKQLKKYLSENYPTKPLEHNMRLIYFGKLLQDHSELKEFIRKGSETEIIHNVHLIYTQCKNDGQNETTSSQASTTQQSNIRPETPLNQQNTTQFEHQQTQPLTPLEQYNYIFSNLKRQYDLAGISLNNQWNLTYLQHLALYYHMNANYLQSLGLTTNATHTQPTLTTDTQNNDENDLENDGFQQDPAQNQQQQPQPQDQPNFQQQQQQQQIEDNDNDWLSIIHNAFSFIVLFTVIYFYSSLTRFFIVFAVVMLLLMYHNGWFTLERRRANQPANEAEANAPQQQQQQQQQEVNPQNADQPQQPSILSLLLRFIITFFTSLIPERARIQNQN